MGQYSDIYVAVKTRSKRTATEFLNHFLPNRVEGADEFELPQYSNRTDYQFTTANNLMSYLEINGATEYNLYWRNTDESNPNKHGMLFYTYDDAIIFGISRDADIGGDLDTDNEDECLNLMKEFFKTELGYIAYENTPYRTFEEFNMRLKLDK